MIQAPWHTWGNADRPVLDQPLPLAELELPSSGTHYLAHETVRHPTRVYERDLISAGKIERSTPVPAGFPRLSDATIRIADVAKKWRKLLAAERARAGKLKLKLGNVGDPESHAYLVFRGEIISARFPPGEVVLTASDITFGKISEHIPSLVTQQTFSLPEGVEEIFAPICYGNLSTASTTMLGAVSCPWMGGARYLVARHKMAAIDSVYVWSPGDEEFEVVPPRVSSYAETAYLARRVFGSNAGWVKVEESIEIDARDYDFTYIDFDSPLPEGSLVRADVQGQTDVDGNLITNPIWILKDILTRWMEIADTAENYNYEKFSTAAQVADSLNYVGANQTNQSMTWQAMISRLLASFNIDYSADNRGRLQCVIASSDPGNIPVYDDLEILDDTFEDALPEQVFNRLTFRCQLIPSTNDWYTTGVVENELDQAAIGKTLNQDLDMHWVQSEVIGEAVAADIAGYLDLASVRLKFGLSAPRVVEEFDLSSVVAITHFEGVEETTGAWVERRFKVVGIRLDLDDLSYEVDCVSRQALPVEGGGELPDASIVSYLVPGPFQFGRQSDFFGVFCPFDDFTKLRTIYSRDWGQTWSSVDTAVFATDITSAQVYQRDNFLHCVTLEGDSGRVAYHRFNALLLEWDIEDEEVIAQTAVDSTVRSGEDAHSTGGDEFVTYPSCDIVVRENGEVVIAYTDGVRAFDDGTEESSDVNAPGFFWFPTQHCIIRAAGVWGSPIRIGKNWEDTTGVFVASEAQARGILGPDGVTIYYHYGTMGHETPNFLGTYFSGLEHYAISSLGATDEMTHHCRWLNANIHGTFKPGAGILGRVESDSLYMYGGMKGNFNFHSGTGMRWEISELSEYHTLLLSASNIHPDLLAGRVTTDLDCQFSPGAADRPSFHVSLVDGSPQWIYLTSSTGDPRAPRWLQGGTWVRCGSYDTDYNDIASHVFKHGGKKFFAHFIFRAGILDHFELWSEDSLPVEMTLAEWTAEHG